MRARWLVVVAMLSMVPSVAAAVEIVVFVPGAVQAIVREVGKDYEAETGNTIRFVGDTAGGVVKRIAAGEGADVVIATAAGLAGLAKSGHVSDPGRRDLGAMGVGVAVRKGAPKPDIGSVAAFKNAMLSTKSIMYADPAKGGQSGIHIVKVMAELGIDKDIQPKLALRDRGPDGLKEVAAGTIDIGLGQISEILAEPGVDLVGPFPQPIQNLVTFSAAPHAKTSHGPAAAALIEMLIGPRAKALFNAAGFV